MNQSQPITPQTINCKGKLIDLSTPKIMGILNLTPDSFYAPSQINQAEQLLQTAQQMLAQGATFLDIGGYSTRPNATYISPDEELSRILPAIKILSQHLPQAILSVDTFRATVARQAIEAGAHLVNDISGGTLDDQMFQTVAQMKVPYILMHLKGTPQTMQSQTHYQDMIGEITNHLLQKINQLRQLGLKDVIIDVGFGFAKTIDQNYHLLNHLQRFQILELPILTGISRKSMVWKTINKTPNEALNGTSALHLLALQKGSNILRVHDVAPAMEIIKIFEKITQNQ